MSGWIPTPIRNVKPFVAIVQPGDSVSRISERLTGDRSRWPELVGANLHKPLGTGAVGGTPYRAFESIEANEPLMVPSSWPDPDPGLVGAVMKATPINKANQKNVAQKPNLGQEPVEAGGLGDPLLTAITTILQTLPTVSGTPLPTLPAGFKIEDIATVIRTWWPLLPGMTPPGGTQPTLAIPPTQAYPAWLALVTSVSSLLTSLGLSSDQIDFLFAIPWTKIPWDKIPWGKLIAGGVDPTAFWNLLIGASSGSPPGVLSDKPSMNGPDNSINLFDATTWSKEPYKSALAFGLPKNNVTDAPTVWGNIDDMGLLSCIAANPARAAELAKLASCFTGDMTKLKLYMCNPQLDASKCASTKVDPAIPTVPPGVNWACPNPPQCIADQLKTLGIPDPCDPMPACIPTWYKNITGQNPPAPETKKESNLPLYVGLTVAGVALVAGVVVVIAAAD